MSFSSKYEDPLADGKTMKEVEQIFMKITEARQKSHIDDVIVYNFTTDQIQDLDEAITWCGLKGDEAFIDPGSNVAGVEEDWTRIRALIDYSHNAQITDMTVTDILTL